MEADAPGLRTRQTALLLRFVNDTYRDVQASLLCCPSFCPSCFACEALGSQARSAAEGRV
jgi:hypothetical protein